MTEALLFMIPELSVSYTYWHSEVSFKNRAPYRTTAGHSMLQAQIQPCGKGGRGLTYTSNCVDRSTFPIYACCKYATHGGWAQIVSSR